MALKVSISDDDVSRAAFDSHPDATQNPVLAAMHRYNLRLKLFLLVLLLIASGRSVALASDILPSEAVTTRVVVREAPSSQSAAISSLRPGEQAELLGEVPNWYRVRLKNEREGFVSKRWTRVRPAPSSPATATTPSFTLDVVDVGTGLAVLVRGQDFTLVYDAGSNDDAARGAGNRMLAYMKAVAPSISTIDHILLSHPHRDHVELLPDLLDTYQVRHVWDSGRMNPICGYRAFIEAIQAAPGVEYHTVTQDEGVSSISFNAQTCYGQSLAATTIQISHASRLQAGVPIPLGQNASMTILYADGAARPSVNENSLVVRLDLGPTRVLLMGDAEAGGRRAPSIPSTTSSIEGILLSCCVSELSADVLVVGHHGSMTSSRRAFLSAVNASTFIVSAGPTRYGSVVLPDHVVIAELSSRGQVFRTDLNDDTCGQNSSKIGPVTDGRAGGCDNIRVIIAANGTANI
ncbi:MAG: MBL fold metallo-hydrolase, partial [Dehalococcoidia bacterium]|nr:MBL fold metallo-hydrolase [Dehalococcoidia bacterium]